MEVGSKNYVAPITVEGCASLEASRKPLPSDNFNSRYVYFFIPV
jgi:hypothetical protein